MVVSIVVISNERPATIFVWFVPSTRILLAKVVYMLLC